MKFYATAKQNKLYVLSPSFVAMCPKLTNLYGLNHDKLRFTEHTVHGTGSTQTEPGSKFIVDNNFQRCVA